MVAVGFHHAHLKSNEPWESKWIRSFSRQVPDNVDATSSSLMPEQLLVPSASDYLSSEEGGHIDTSQWFMMDLLTRLASISCGSDLKPHQPRNSLLPPSSLMLIYLSAFQVKVAPLVLPKMHSQQLVAAPATPERPAPLALERCTDVLMSWRRLCLGASCPLRHYRGTASRRRSTRGGITSGEWVTLLLLFKKYSSQVRGR